MKVFAVALNMHDHNTYDGHHHRQEERYSRLKHNISSTNPHDSTLSRKFFTEHFLPAYQNLATDDILAFTCSNLGREFTTDLITDTLGEFNFLKFKPNNIWEYYSSNGFYYIDHHQSHAAYAFLSSGFLESDILAIDGQGSNFTCIFINKDGDIINLSDKLSIGSLWNIVSRCIGFSYLNAGKTMGLAAYGKYDKNIEDIIHGYLKNFNHKLTDSDRDIIENTNKEDIAFTIQKVTIDIIKKWVFPLKTSDNICVSGGVAYNGYMNEELTKHYKNVHVPPAVGDEGQAIGTYMHADYVLNKNIHIPNVYAGAIHHVDPSIFKDLKWQQAPFEKIIVEVAESIASGKIVGWYQGKSESGNRALGNRSILADPRNPNIKNIINSTIKKREDFRPFAPSVLEEHYQEFFDTNQPSPYMSRIVPVKSDKIPGVTHIDNTARIQTVNRQFNQRFYDVINEFYKLTDIPMLVNTSFNCQEPIIETPQEAVNTFLNTELDILVIDDYIIRK